MWRRISPVIICLVLLFIFATTAQASTQSTQIIVNGKTLSFDTQPVIDNGRVLVPPQEFFEALGIVTDWDAMTQTITATRKDGIKIKIPATLVDGRALFPLRFVSEILDATVSWKNSVITITLTDSIGSEHTPVAEALNTSDVNGKSAYQLYHEAYQALKKANSFAVNKSTCIDMNEAGQQDVTTQNSTQTVKIVTLSPNNIQVAIAEDMQLYKNSIFTREYYKDGYYYEDSSYEDVGKIKRKISPDDTPNIFAIDWFALMVKSQQVNGNTLSFVLNKHALTIDQAVTPILDMYGLKDAKVSYSDIYIAASLDNNHQLNLVNIRFSAYATLPGRNVTTVNYDSTTKFTQIGNVSIDFPNDLGSYTLLQ